MMRIQRVANYAVRRAFEVDTWITQEYETKDARINKAAKSLIAQENLRGLSLQ